MTQAEQADVDADAPTEPQEMAQAEQTAVDADALTGVQEMVQAEQAAAGADVRTEEAARAAICDVTAKVGMQDVLAGEQRSSAAAIPRGDMHVCQHNCHAMTRKCLSWCKVATATRFPETNSHVHLREACVGT